MIPYPPMIEKENEFDSSNLWEIYTNHGKGFKSYILAETAKEAIKKFESKFREEWIDQPYSIISIIYLGTITK